jgi:TPP-dependent pyruvate/acetoin dehydrogenase alpha subunit
VAGYSDWVTALTRSDLLGMYRAMVEIREFEEQVQRSFTEGLVFGTTHLCQGQEAVSVGAAKALRPDDYVTYTYRGHGHCLARGISKTGAFAELFGRATGVSGGLGGSMHLTDFPKGLIGSFGIVGAGLPVAVGAGLSAQLKGKGQVSVTFFGDGSTNIGAFHEAMNIAVVWKLPVIFVCENNLYGEFSRIDHTTPYEDLIRRAEGYAMPARMVDGNDVLTVYEAAGEAVERGRRGEGPTFLECKTYRHRGHSRTDPAKYRAAEEVKSWLARDPIPLFAQYLREQNLQDEADQKRLVEEVRREVQAAAKEAAEAPWPDPAQMDAATFA